MRRRVAALLVGAGLCSLPAAAQQTGFSGHYLNVGTRVGTSAIGPGGLSDFQRFRLMWAGAVGPLFVEMGYEHTLTLRERGAAGAGLFTGVGVATGGDWLPLDGEIVSDERVSWRHRVDRLSVRADLGASADIVVGRQPVSWATTLFLTPADPFSPFDPADPFREYRAGVDAVRFRYYQGALTSVEVVARLAGSGDQRTVTALARAASNYRGWDIGGWVGAVHETFGAAVFASGSVGLWAVRAEGAVRDTDDGTALRAAVGADRTFSVAGRDLYVVAEYQRDGFGSATPAGLLDAAASPAFAHGEMQVLGRDVGALQLSYQVHPLASASLMALGNLRDGSVLVGPGLGWSASERASLRVGGFFGVGAEATVAETGLSLGSEYGAVPGIGFASLSVFF